MRVFAILALVTGLSSPNIQAHEVQNRIEVCVHTGPLFALTHQAEEVASAIYADIGIKVEWFHGRHCPDGAVEITLTYNRPYDFFPGALAYAKPNEGGTVEVFGDRLRAFPLLRRDPVLGHIFAHEIGHLLQRINQHSETGVMKAHWNERDFAAMERKPLSFTESDVTLIRQGLAARETHLFASR